MKRRTTTICLTIGVLLGSAGCQTTSTIERGLTAAKSGAWTTAKQEFTQLAEQGI
jgi:hypothetical protein